MVGMATEDDLTVSELLLRSEKEDLVIMSEQDTPAFLQILKRLCVDEHRQQALQFLGKIKALPSGLDATNCDFSQLILPKGELKEWMFKAVESGSKEGLSVWCTLVKALGEVLHLQGDGTTLLNSLLQVVERAFKHQSNDIRKQAYQSWMTLMDNFALNPSVLTSSKRVRLIVRPLLGSISNRNEEQVKLKFLTWWHYIGLLGLSIHKQVDTVVLPFLKFCYSSSVATTSGLAQSPAKKYDSLRAVCLEATAILFSGLNEVKAIHLDITAVANSLSQGVIKADHFRVHYNSIIKVVTDLLETLHIKKKSENDNFTAILKAVCKINVESAHGITPEHGSTIHAISYFLELALDVMRAMKAFNCAEANEHILFVLQQISKLPDFILSVSATWERVSFNGPHVGRETPARVMLKFLYIQTLMPHIFSDNFASTNKDKFFSLLSRFLNAACLHKPGQLVVFEDGMEILKDRWATSIPSNTRDGVVCNMWKMYAQTYVAYVDKFNDVIHKVSIHYKPHYNSSIVLLFFPIRYCLNSPSKLFWKLWVEALNKFNEKAPLLLTYTTLQMEEKLAEEVLKLLHEKEQQTFRSQEWISLTTIVSQNLLNSIPFQSLSQESQVAISGECSDNPLGVLQKILDVLVKLLLLLPQYDDKNAALALAQQLLQVLTQISCQRLQRPLLKLLGPTFEVVFGNKQLESHGPKFEALVKSAHNVVVTRFQSQYDGPFDVDLQNDMKTFITAALCHPNSEVKSKTGQMWQLTFGSTLKEDEVDKGIDSLLYYFLRMKALDPSPQGPQPAIGDGDTPEFAVPVTFGHIFDKQKLTHVNKVAAKTSTPDKKQVPNPSKKSAKSSKVSIDEENSQDFVKIASPASKKRILTEHQKEVMRQRKDDIPALYSELSRDDSTSLSAMFHSQNSVSIIDATSSSQPEVPPPVVVTPAEEPKDSDVLIVNINSQPDGERHSAPENTDTDSQDDEEANQSRPRRKGRKPKKLLEAEQSKVKRQKRGRVTKTLGENQGQIDTVSSEVEVLSSQPVEEDSQPKKRRGRPPKKAKSTLVDATPILLENGSKKRKRSVSPLLTDGTPDENGIDTNDDDVAKVVPDSSITALSAQLTSQTKVHILQLSPNQMKMSTHSPVKVVKEVPLILEPVQTAPVSFDIDNEIIESSQTLEEESTKSRKRRRHSFAGLSKTVENVIEGSDPADKRPTRKAALKHSISSTINVPGKENEGPLAGQIKPKTKTNKYGESPLHVAIKKGDFDKVKTLVASGADINVKDHAGWTPLHEAAAHVGSHAKDIIELLVSNGAEINAAANNGATPLHDAIAFMSQDCVQFLLENGADPMIENKDGKTARSLAPEHLQGLFDKIKPNAIPSPSKAVSESWVISAENAIDEPIKDSDEASENLNDSSNSVLATPLDVSHDGDLDARSEMPPSEFPPSARSEQQDSVEIICEQQESVEAMDVHQESVEAMDVQQESLTGNHDDQESVGVNGKDGSLPQPHSEKNDSTGLIKPPLPVFKPAKAKVLTSVFSSRGARLLEMSKAKAESPTSAGGLSSSPNPMLMSPRPELPTKTLEPGVTTPTQSGNQPWQKFAPSPCDASPSAGILKRSSNSDAATSESTTSENAKDHNEAPPVKRRRVQFTDPPVSDQVVIPRCPSGKATRQRLQETRFNREMFLGPISKDLSKTQFEATDINSSEESENSAGLYEPTPPLSHVSPNCIYPSLVDCDDPVSTILNNLTTKTWHKAAEKSLSDNGIQTIGDLSKLTAVKANAIKSLKPPNNLFTIKEALRKYEKNWLKRGKEREKKVTTEASSELDEELLSRSQKEQSPTAAPVIDNECTPEEEEEAMKEIYERPSPSPTESLEHVDLAAKEGYQVKEVEPEEISAIIEEKEFSTTAVQAGPSVSTSETMTADKVMVDFSHQKDVSNTEVGISTTITSILEANCQTDKLDLSISETMAALENFSVAELSEVISKAAELIQKKVTGRE